MIKKLDWYVLKKYFATTFFMVMIFSLISVVIDASEKTDDFVKSGLSTFQIITQYYVGFVPFIISMIFPLMVFIAVIFFTSKMAGRSEIVAVLAGGIRFTRFMRPYVTGALLLGGFFWYATQYLIPKANVIRGDFQTRYIDSKSSYEIGQYYSKGSNFYLRVDTNTYAAFRNYDTTSKTATQGFFMERFNNNQMVYNLRADYIRWDTATRQWELKNVVERNINGLKETQTITPTKMIKLAVKP
ncbi:MAG TPA: LptF/LptG family permease, partial [Chitinophagaceae bacterium]|nr:LptF/LptG family permease [Chitinophagaceae bacterium]